MYALAITTEAEDDVKDATVWWERQRKGLGIEFLAEVGLTIARVRQNPELYGRVYGQLRRAPVHHFRYGVFFRFKDDRVKVVGVLHNRRSPKVWKKRK